MKHRRLTGIVAVLCLFLILCAVGCGKTGSFANHKNQTSGLAETTEKSVSAVTKESETAQKTSDVKTDVTEKTEGPTEDPAAIVASEAEASRLAAESAEAASKEEESRIAASIAEASRLAAESAEAASKEEESRIAASVAEASRLAAASAEAASREEESRRIEESIEESIAAVEEESRRVAESIEESIAESIAEASRQAAEEESRRIAESIEESIAESQAEASRQAAEEESIAAVEEESRRAAEEESRRAAEAATTAPVRSLQNYIANLNTHKFHYPGCRSVGQMKEENKWYFYGDRQELIDQGYEPCKICNP